MRRFAQIFHYEGYQIPDTYRYVRRFSFAFVIPYSPGACFRKVKINHQGITKANENRLT